jgi:hypothetical protein
MKKLAVAGAVACALATSAPIAAAQSCSITSTLASPPSCTVTSTHSLTMPSLLTLTMSGFTSGTNETLNAPATMADYTSSTIQMATTGPTFQVQANRNYQVQISAAAAAFTGTTYAKPASDLAWSTSSGGTFTALTTTPTNVSTGTPTSLSASVGIFYKTTYKSTSDIPGTYSLGVTFTLVAP